MCKIYISEKPSPSIIVSHTNFTISVVKLKKFFSKYGEVTNWVSFSYFTIIEFSETQPAKFVYDLSREQNILIGSNKMQLFYSNKSTNYFNFDMKSYVSSILELNVTNVNYDINVGVIKRLTSGLGIVKKIYIGGYWQNEDSRDVYIEFDKLTDAMFARETLDKSYIYRNCCKVSAKFSMLQELYIEQNMEYSWSLQLDSIKNSMDRQKSPSSCNYDDSDESTSLCSENDLLAMCNSTKKFVFMVDNIPSNLSIEHIYNIFSLYGRIIRIKYKSKPTWRALVEMEKAYSVQTCVKYFHDQQLFDNVISIVPTRIRSIAKPSKMQTLPNGSTSFMNFYNNAHYSSLVQLDSRNPRDVNPTKTLHFYNTPNNFDENKLRHFLNSHKAPQPRTVVLFRKPVPFCTTKGLMEFHNIQDALKTICLVNNRFVRENSSKSSQGTSIKLVFSSREFVNKDSEEFRPTVKKRQFKRYQKIPNNKRYRYESNSLCDTNSQSDEEQMRHCKESESWCSPDGDYASDKENFKSEYRQIIDFYQ